MRIANLEGRLDDDYLFHLELPRAVSRLHAFTTCDHMNALSVLFTMEEAEAFRIATPIHSPRVNESEPPPEERRNYGNRQWIHGSTSTSYVAVIDIPPAEWLDENYVIASVIAADDGFRGVVFNARAIYDEPGAYGRG
ncbi:MAG: hypothetical protein WDN30_06635 [Pararobbsia sp.]